MAPEFFLNPTHPMQRRYEALRASFVEGLSAHEVAKKFGYSVHTLNALRRDFKADSLQPFFLPLTRGPNSPRPPTGCQGPLDGNPDSRVLLRLTPPSIF
jgi:transposase-like protein